MSDLSPPAETERPALSRKRPSHHHAKRSSTLVSILVHALLLLIGLYVVVFQSTPKEEVAFIPPDRQRPNLEPRKLEMKVRVNQLTKRSSRPRLQPRMMVNAPSDLSLPEIKHDPNANRNKVQRTFKTMGTSGFGTGIGGGYGTGMGGGMGVGVNFMGSESSGTRFAFVIDYSKSMSQLQQRVTKAELYSALEEIGDYGLATVLFFSGPVWRPDQDEKTIRPLWQGNNGNGWFLKEEANGPDPQWFYPNSHNLAAMERMIYETPTTFGTDWYHPIKFVLKMEPPPDVIFFMTDGRSSKNTITKTLEMIDDLPKDQVVINTVALGVKPQDSEPLEEIAKMTGGEFKSYDDAQLKEREEKLDDIPDNFSSKSIRYEERVIGTGMHRAGGPIPGQLYKR